MAVCPLVIKAAQMHSAMFLVDRRRTRLITRPGLEPGKTEPKSVVLPITPPGYGRHSAETRSTELRASGILVTESQGGKVRFDGTMAVTAVPS